MKRLLPYHVIINVQTIELYIKKTVHKNPPQIYDECIAYK